MVQPFLEGKTLAEALNDRKMYLMDLTYMAHIDCASRKEVCVFSISCWILMASKSDIS